MKTLKGNDIAEQIKRIKPHTIIVAYIGYDWADYIDTENIERIVVSPTMGSNPYGIETLKQSLGGWNKIGFMDNLHAKLYLGKNQAVIGSPNLSRNALGEGGLEEFAVLVDDAITLNQCSIFAEEIWAQTGTMYPDDKSKSEKLKELMESSATLASAINKSSPSFLDYNYKRQNAYPVWWNLESEAWDSKVLKRAGIFEEDPEGMYFSKDDIVNDKTKWLITYEISSAGKPITNTVGWMYCHRFVKDSSFEEDYPNGLIQLKGEFTPKPPFKIDQKFKTSFAKVLTSGKFDSILDNQNDIWRVKAIEKSLPKFFQAIKEEYPKK